MNTEHTPIPWRSFLRNVMANSRFLAGCYADNYEDNPAGFAKGQEPLQSYQEAEANAQFICKAVNCHDELVEALEDVASGCTIPKERLQRLLAKAKGVQS